MGALPVAVADRAAPGFAIAFQPIVDIAGRRIVVDREALGFGVTVFLGVKLATRGRISVDDFDHAQLQSAAMCDRSRIHKAA